MENASKALIMAGSVLIALMIIGALILMFSNLTSYQESNVQATRDAQIIEFNNQYETYNRKNVRGSDVYSLLNRAIDYNERRTTTSVSGEGASIAYEPITIVVDFNNQVNKLSAENLNELITKNIYTQSGTKNEFDEDVKATIDNIEKEYGQVSLTNLTTALTKIYISTPTGSNAENQKRLAIENFNNASKVKKVNTWDELQNTKEDVYKYYEYIQFKRAYFNCEEVKYNQNTGRIIEMQFKFTGKME